MTLVGGPLTEPILEDRAEAGVTPLVGKMMGTDPELPRRKGSTLEPPPGATDQRLLDQGVTDRAVKRLHPGRIRPGLLEIRGLHNSKMGMVVMRLIVITPTSQRKRRATTNKEEKTARGIPKGLHCTPASSIVGERKSHVVSPLGNRRVWWSIEQESMLPGRI